MSIERYPIALLVDILDRTVDDAIADALAEADHGEITRSLGTVFEMIDPGGSRVVDMARRARMTKQGMGQLVAALEQLGYVDRRPDPGDRRAQLVVLTAKGREAASAGRDGLDAIEAAWRRRLGRERYSAVREALVDLVRATGMDHVR